VNTTLVRTLVVYAVILPLAVFIGWVAVDLANWNRTSFAMFAAILFVLLLPALLKWHYPVMLFSWNTAITIFFLPGSPSLWMLMAGITFGIAVLNRIIQKRRMFLSVPAVTATLLALLAVVVITGKLRGGFGSQALGSATYGGKGYYYIIAAIIGYFALASQPIPPGKAKFYVGLFFLPGVISAVSTLIYSAGPAFYFLYLIFPVGFAGVQALSEYTGPIIRVAGLAGVAGSIAYYLLAVHGIRGVLRKWWLGLLLLVALVLGMFAGYRSLYVLLVLIFAILFVMEGLLRSPIFPAFILIAALGFAVLAPFASKLPLSVQRTLSVLPLKIDPVARWDAAASSDWRLQMWRSMLPDLPKYIWLGKGYAMNPTDMYLAHQAVLRGRAVAYESSIVTGDYHSGPLSIYVPFGSFGLLALLLFFGASLRVLYLNYKHGDNELKIINRFLFCYFLGRLIFFLFAFGGISSDLFHFTGALGLSVALNRGVCRRSASVTQPVRFGGNLGLPAPRPAI
jgi:O-antigen ligase